VSDPCASPAGKEAGPPGEDRPVARDPSDKALTPEAEIVTERKVVKVFETVTETVKVTAAETAALAAEKPDTVVETVRVTLTESAAATASEPAAQPA